MLGIKPSGLHGTRISHPPFQPDAIDPSDLEIMSILADGLLAPPHLTLVELGCGEPDELDPGIFRNADFRIPTIILLNEILHAYCSGDRVVGFI